MISWVTVRIRVIGMFATVNGEGPAGRSRAWPDQPLRLRFLVNLLFITLSRTGAYGIVWPIGDQHLYPLIREKLTDH